LSEAVYFHERLREKGMPFVTFVVNRVHALPGARVPRERSTGAASGIDPGLSQALVGLFRDQRALAESEARLLARLDVDTRAPVVLVPEMEADVHDLRGLRDFATRVLA
jgi:hypothetical protein